MLERLPLSVRIFAVYCVFVGLSAYFVLNTVMDEIKPGVRQSTEETLVDTANLLAELLREDVKNGTLNQSRFPEIFQAYGQRRPQARIWGIEKTLVNHRIYVTDHRGIVLLDSFGEAVGEDYSRWNDVYLTLRGQYGARTSPEGGADESATVMHVAAPIVDAGKIIGAVTVAKPNRAVQPYIDRTERRLGWLGGGLIALSLLVGGFFSWWLSRAIRGLTQYAQAVSAGERVQLPQAPSGELKQLAQALESMRTQLEGKAYVERYVQTLTHELKSPLAAIHGAAELLRQEMPPEQRTRFVNNIDRETLRLQQLIERLLNLALVEQRRGLEETVAIPLRSLVEELLRTHIARIQGAKLELINAIPANLNVRGERFLVRQALINLLDNALDFTPQGGLIRIAAEAHGDRVAVCITNSGDPVPEYALPRLTERFYSLPRKSTGRKSTGLGLNFVQEVAQLHGGALTVRNVADGVEARLVLPAP